MERGNEKKKKGYESSLYLITFYNKLSCDQQLTHQVVGNRLLPVALIHSVAINYHAT